MYFMIDYENTHGRGLLGTEYLNAEDVIIIFYSNSCKKVEWGRLQDIVNARCKFEACCLHNTGKNAMDYYIASRIGEIYGAGYEGTIAIISGDNGFKAVKDYWNNCSAKRRKIILKQNIQESIVSSNENSGRRKNIQEMLKEVDIMEAYKKYEEYVRIHNELEEVFAGSGYEKMIDQIMDIVKEKKSPKVIYTDSLKRFGRAQGLGIYRAIKKAVC